MPSRDCAEPVSYLRHTSLKCATSSCDKRQIYADHLVNDSPSHPQLSSCQVLREDVSRVLNGLPSRFMRSLIFTHHSRLSRLALKTLISPNLSYTSQPYSEATQLRVPQNVSQALPYGAKYLDCDGTWTDKLPSISGVSSTFLHKPSDSLKEIRLQTEPTIC